MIKRYLLFCGDSYYPAGWSDFVSASDSISDLLATAKTKEYRDWYEIVDLETLSVFEYGKLSTLKENESNIRNL